MISGRRLVRPGAAGCGVLAASAAIVVARSGANAETSYAGTTWTASLATFVAALSLFAAVLLARSGIVPGLAFTAGICWLAPIAVGWLSWPPPVRATATIAGAFTLPLLAHLALASTGQHGRRGSRVVLAAAYAWATLSSIGLALARDPFYDPNCWADCDGNAFLLRSSTGLTDAILAVRPWVELLLAVAIVVLGLAALRASQWAGRVAALAATAVGGAVVLRAFGRMTTPREDPLDPTLRVVFVTACATVVLVALALVAPRVETALRRRSVTRIVGALDDAPAPHLLERALAGGLGDPGLRLVFSLPEDGRCVDAAGRPSDRPAPARGRAVTPLVRTGQPVAWIDHDAAVVDAIEPSLTPAVRLAIDNARLRLGVVTQLRELRIARRRIVGEGDDERRRLERDLHDGVQQQLLALGAELRSGVRIARNLGHEVSRSLEAAVEETTILLDEVRKLAHGVYPAILTDAGLGPAVASLADVAGLPVKLTGAPTRRYPSSVEATAYRVVAEGVENAVRHSDATMVDVGVREVDDSVMVDVRDDGHGGAAVASVGGLAELVDRVRAIDGSITIESSPEDGTTISAVIPCAS
jgi:signal transduction histidine kinase